MPTILSHALVPLAVAALAGPARISPRVAMGGALLAMLPDADVITFHFGVAYGDTWGHRGAAHSLIFAGLIVTALGTAIPKLRQGWTLPFLFLAMASHGLLDTLTDGGKGVALLWPFSDARLFAPWRPIRVSPIGARFLSLRGLATLISEAQWIWLPCAAIILGAKLRHQP